MPLSYDARYRAKQLIDSFIYRNGEGLTAGVNALIDVVFVIPIVVYPVTAIMMSFMDRDCPKSDETISGFGILFLRIMLVSAESTFQEDAEENGALYSCC